MKNILCVDIGGTRIKSAVLSAHPSLDDLKAASYDVRNTLGWLNSSLPKLLDFEHQESLASLYRQRGISYDAVALSVPGEIDGQGRFKRKDLVNGPAKVPEKLVEAFKKLANCPVTVIKDANAWMVGFQEYAALRGLNIKYPAVLVALGTGIGVSVATSFESFENIELSGWPAQSWVNLSNISGYPIREGWHAHHVIGKQFFGWVEKEHPEWDYGKIRTEFTKRVRAALDDILIWIEKIVGNRVSTIILGGGNASNVYVQGISLNIERAVIPLIDQEIKFSPDVIPILGVETYSRRFSFDK
jgi:hypothetical protein